MRQHVTASSPRQAAGPRRYVRGGLAALSLAVLLALLLVPSASAAQLVEFGQFGNEAGGGGGQIGILEGSGGEGVAINSTGAGGVEPGETYVLDFGNRRVEEFSADGDFVRTWGKDVDATEAGTGFEICTAASGHTCKTGVPSGEAGAFLYPHGIAIDQKTGNVYVGGGNNLRIDAFGATGKFEGSFGWGVNASSPANELQFCTVASGCQAGQATVSAGGFQGIYSGALAVDPTTDHLRMGDDYNHRINEFSLTSNADKEVTGVSFIRALGWNVNASTPAEELQECSALTGCQEGTVGSGDGQLNEVNGLAIDSGGSTYAISSAGNCTSETPCRVMKFNANGTFKETFGPTSGGDAKCQLNWTNNVFSTEEAATSIAVNSVSQHVFLTRKTSDTTFEICEFNSDGKLLQRSPSEPILTVIGGGMSLATAPEGHVDVVALNAFRTASPVRIFGIVPAAPAEVLPPTEVTPTSATLNGEVTTPQPGGAGFDVRYRFEYSSDNGSTWLRAPSSGTASVGSTSPGPHVVQQKITNLLANSTYRVRLVTITSDTTTSEERTFTTPVGPPRISEIRASNADQTSVKLEAAVNPNGSPTSYRVEWGATTAYGHSVPSGFEPFVGSGHEPTPVAVTLADLSQGNAYHYRVVAHNAGGSTVSPDQIVETLNSCGLPEGRCFELVSRREAGPVAIPGETVSPAELHFQAATNPGALAYVVEAGYPEASKGAEVLYRGTRGPNSWESTQISNPFVAPNEQAGLGNGSGNTKFLSDDVSCGFAESPQPLTDDPGTRLAIESGGTNLYRVNPDNSYTAVTKLPPENSEGREGRNNFNVAYASQDCGVVLFSSIYHYPGIAGKDSTAVPSRLYEWDEGTLRNVGAVPGPGGEEVVVEAEAGTGTNSLNTVSEDGSRIFFSASRQASPNSEEIGKEAVFVREDGGASVRDISLSQTGTPDKAAAFQWATPDGSRAFFTANAGLTEESSPEGTDLYEYNLETEELIDRSVSQVEGGAQVAGFVGAAEDGSHVYFISRAQLVTGRGDTQAENQSAHTYSIYGESAGEVSFVATIGQNELNRVALQGGDRRSWSSRVSPDGRYLLFVSSANVTGYVSGGSWEAYLYDADGGAQGVTCISCRQDGQPSVGPEGYEVLSKGEAINNPTHPAQSLVIHEGEPRVFFNSPDTLAPGAEEGQNNVYEWAHGQVFRLSSAPEGQLVTPISGFGNAFVGASDDGSDVYLFTPETLNWEDGDERVSVYDARLGGGYPEPPAPPVPCEATSEGSCQGAAQGAPALSGAASAAFNGPGNPPEQPNKKKSKKKPHKKKHKHAKKKKSKDKTQARQANGNRRAGK